MMKRAPAILFGFLAALSAAMLATLLALVGGVVSLDTPSARSRTAIELAPPAKPVTETTQAAETTAGSTDTTEEPDSEAPAAATTTTAAPQPAPTIVVVTASRGDSWFSARVGSESGRVLDERVLPQGESVRLQGPRIWLTVGAAGNVDVTVNGRPRTIAPGTVELLLTRATSAAN